VIPPQRGVNFERDLTHLGGYFCTRFNTLGVLEVMNFREDELQAYEDHLKWLRIEANTLKKYEAKGFSEGKAEGIVEGEARGIEKGKKERDIEIVHAMVDQGISLEAISAVTGLSPEELKKMISMRS